MDITSNIANIDIGEGMDIDSYADQTGASLSAPFTPQRKGKAKQNISPQTPQLQGASRVTGMMIFL